MTNTNNLKSILVLVLLLLIATPALGAEQIEASSRRLGS